MLSTRLVQLIEGNWETIAGRLIREIYRHPDMQKLASRPEADIREWCRTILQDLGHLLTAKNEAEVKRRFETLGRARFEEDIPLHEGVLRLHLLKDKILGFIHDQGFTMDTLQLYAEEELTMRMGRFFDASVYHLVRGYEAAMRRSIAAGS